MKWHIAFGTLIAVCLSSVMAFADADPLAPPKDRRAAEHLKQGNRSYRLRDFEAAIVAYKAGAAIEEANVFWYNLGQSYRQLGNYEESLWYYQRFLDRGRPSGELQTAVLDFIAKMNAERDKAASKQPPTEAGGDDAGKVSGSNAPSADASSNRDNASTVDRDPTDADLVVSNDEAPRWHNDIVGWAIVGGGAVALGVGTGLLVNASGLHTEANEAMSETERVRLHDKAQSRRTLGLVVTGLGGVLAAVGVVKLALVPNRRDTAVQVSASSSGIAVGLAGRF